MDNKDVWKEARGIRKERGRYRWRHMWQVIITWVRDCMFNSNPSWCLEGRVYWRVWSRSWRFVGIWRAIVTGSHAHENVSGSTPRFVSLPVCSGLQQTRVFSSYSRSRGESNKTGQWLTILPNISISFWPCHGGTPCARNELDSIVADHPIWNIPATPIAPDQYTAQIKKTTPGIQPNLYHITISGLFQFIWSKSHYGKG